MSIALCLFHKDENSYLPEWIDHHRRLGISQFYIYDNGSRPMPCPERDVRVVDFSHDQQLGKQARAYFECHSTFRVHHKWIGFLDTDEFILGDVCRLLARLRSGWFSSVTQVSISTRFYGSNGHAVRQEKQVGSYGDCWMPNELVKSFVHCGRPMRNVPADPHFFSCYGTAVNAHGEPHTGPTGPHIDEPVVIDHYYTRSRAEWAEKCQRGRGDGAGHRTMAEFDGHNTAVTAYLRNRPSAVA
jgi:hypothetical protein